MQVTIPDEVYTPIKSLMRNTFDVYLVGGALRDLLLGKELKDWDFTTKATPEQMLEQLPTAFYDNAFGTVGVPTENHGTIEITTFRSEQGYSNKRHPDEIVWGKTIEEDLKRRDFTINAMAIKVTGPIFTVIASDEGARQSPKVSIQRIIDPYGGQNDLMQKILRTVGDPNERFGEDALRLMRAIRIATQLGFQIEEQTLAAIGANAPAIGHISFERIRDELFKILASDFAYDGMMLLRNTGLLSEIIPELEQCFGVNQVGPNRHHIYDVGTHNFLSLKTCPSPDPLVRFATLIHDIGKPLVQGKDKRGNPTFYNHEVVGARIANDIATRLRLSNKQREKVVTLVRWHQFSVSEVQTDSAIRRFIRNVGIENIKDMIDLRIGDRLGSGIDEAKKEGWRLQEFKKRIEKELNPPFSIKDLKVNGNDVMQTLNIKPGPQVGYILQKLFEEVDEDMAKNNRDYLLKRISEVGATQKNSE